MIGLLHCWEGFLISNIEGSPGPAELGERVQLGETAITLRFESASSISDGEASAAIEVIRRAFNGSPSWFSLGVDPVDHLRWKAETPSGDALFEIGEEGETIVGVKLSFRQPYRYRGSAATVEVGTDSALDPRYQGRGINSLWTKVRPGVIPLEPASFGIDLQIHPFLRGPEAYPFGNQIDAFLRPLSLRRVLFGRPTGGVRDGPSQTRSTILAGSHAGRFRAMLKKLSFGVRLGLSTLRRPRAPNRVRGWTVSSIDRFDERADTLWEGASTQFDLIQVRDQAWLNWRYCDPRGGPFTVRIAEDGGLLLGYTAFRITDSEAVIADLLTLPGRDDVAASLIDDVVDSARQAGVPRVRCWMARRHPYRQALQRAGFVRYDLPAPVVFEIRTLEPSALDLLSQPNARVHFMQADTDHI